MSTSKNIGILMNDDDVRRQFADWLTSANHVVIETRNADKLLREPIFRLIDFLITDRACVNVLIGGLIGTGMSIPILMVSEKDDPDDQELPLKDWATLKINAPVTQQTLLAAMPQ
jgi:hypothetical protein